MARSLIRMQMDCAIVGHRAADKQACPRVVTTHNAGASLTKRSRVFCIGNPQKPTDKQPVWATEHTWLVKVNRDCITVSACAFKDKPVLNAKYALPTCCHEKNGGRDLMFTIG